MPQKSGLNLQTNADLVVQRFYKIIVALCLVGYGPVVVAQDLSKKIPVVTVSARVPLISYSVRPDRMMVPVTTIDVVNERKYGQVAEVLKNRAVTAGINSSFYTEHFGIVCKKELQLEKSLRVPLRFRLGSLEYSNYLERERRGNR